MQITLGFGAADFSALGDLVALVTHAAETIAVDIAVGGYISKFHHAVPDFQVEVSDSIHQGHWRVTSDCPG